MKVRRGIEQKLSKRPTRHPLENQTRQFASPTRPRKPNNVLPTKLPGKRDPPHKHTRRHKFRGDEASGILYDDTKHARRAQAVTNNVPGAAEMH